MFTKEELNGILILINRVKDISGSEAEVVVHLKNRIIGTINALIQEETKPAEQVEQTPEQVVDETVVTNKK